MKRGARRVLQFCIAMLCASGAMAVCGQSPLDGFDPDAQPFSVLAVATQSDGKILIGGGFSTIMGGLRYRIARINTDGTLDINFNATATSNGSVRAILGTTGWKDFRRRRFQYHWRTAAHRHRRLDPITGTADSFSANTNDAVRVLALQSDGKILVGGIFTNIGGQARNYLARLDPVTGLIDSFNANTGVGSDRGINAIVVQRDGKIVVGGAFTTIGGQARNGHRATRSSDGIGGFV